MLSLAFLFEFIQRTGDFIMRMVLGHFHLVGMCIIAVVGLGCGGGGETGPQLELGRASGVVTLDTQPLEGVVVTLYPNAGGVPASGRTDAQGKFRLTTKEPNDGAVVGHHTVAITDPAEPTVESTGENTSAEAYDVPDPSKMSGKVPAIYTQALNSGLSAEIKPGSNDQLKFELMTKK